MWWLERTAWLGVAIAVYFAYFYDHQSIKSPSPSFITTTPTTTTTITTGGNTNNNVHYPRDTHYAGPSDRAPWRSQYAQETKLDVTQPPPPLTPLPERHRSRDGSVVVVIRNDMNVVVHAYWVPHQHSSPNDYVNNGPMPPGTSMRMNTYIGHLFYFTTRPINTNQNEPAGIDPHFKQSRLFRITPESEDYAYKIDERQQEGLFRLGVSTVDGDTAEEIDPGVYRKDRPLIMPSRPPPHVQHEYTAKHGQRWLNVYPRDPLLYPVLPTDAIGEKRVLHTKYPANGQSNELVLTTVCKSPRVFTIRKFASKEETDWLLAYSERQLNPSKVGDKHVYSSTRVSESAWLPHDADTRVELLYRRALDVLGIPWERVEEATDNLQVVRYKRGGRFGTHTDYFSPFEHGNLHMNHIMKGYNRMVTLLFYLKRADHGGGTTFTNVHDCGEGVTSPFTVDLDVGDAVVFYSMLPDGNLDIYSQHRGDTVEQGEKVIANLWVYDQARMGV